MAASKEATVLVLDVGTTMSAGRGSTPLEAGKNAFEMFVQQKMLFRPKDAVGVVLVGTEETKNDLQANGYEHVYVLQDIQEGPTVALQKTIQAIEPGGAAGDFVDALVVAMDMLINFVGKKKWEKKIIMLTDGGNRVNADPDDVTKILGRLTDMGCTFTVVGVNFDEAGGDLAARVEKSASKKKNEELIRKMVDRVDGSLVTVQNAIELMSQFRARGVLQRPAYSGTLELGPDMKFGVYGYVQTTEQKFPTLKKASLPAEESGEPGTGVKRSLAYHLASDDKVVLTREELVKGFKYGKSLVPFSKVDEEALKYKAEKCLKILGFVSGKHIPRHMLMGSVVCFVATPGSPESTVALSSLIHALVETDRYAVVRYVWRNNASPKLGVLIPEVEADSECLYYSSLPFMEDIRSFPFASLKTRKHWIPNNEQVQCAEDLINSMDLMTAVTDEDGEPTEALAPHQTFNPVLQYFYQCLYTRALKPEDPLPPIDPQIKKYVDPDADLLERAKAQVEHFRAAFPLEVDEKKDKKKAGTRKRIWMDALREDEGDVLEPASKRVKREGEDVSMESILARKEVDEIGTTDPLGDFDKMTKRRDGDFITPAVNQMNKLIKDFVQSAFRGDTYGKALDCLKAVRKCAALQGEAGLFNAFLREIRGLYEGKPKNDFWEMIRAGGLTLIHSEECMDSDVSLAEALAFHKGPVAAAPVAAPPKAEPEEDLFDMLE